MIYCVVPAELAGKLHERLRAEFAGVDEVEVVVEQRAQDRRARGERRQAALGPRPGAAERRQVLEPAGRRIGERRAAHVAVDPPLQLPRWARRHARRLAFVERVEPTSEHAEDLDTARLVTRFQAGETAAFSGIYVRYFDRIYVYLRSLLGESHTAEDVTQQVFLRVLEALPGYERRSQPFRAWLFRIARNAALSHRRKHRRVEAADPATLERLADQAEVVGSRGLAVRPLLLENGKLVQALDALTEDQKQAILLRFVFDMSNEEIAAALERSVQAVRALQHRGLRELEARMSVRERQSGRRTPMRVRFRPARVARERRYATVGYGRPPALGRGAGLNRYRA